MPYDTKICQEFPFLRTNSKGSQEIYMVIFVIFKIRIPDLCFRKLKTGLSIVVRHNTSQLVKVAHIVNSNVQ